MANKILIVDDDPLTLDLLEQELSGNGYAVERAAGGTEALDKVETFRPDVILLDYGLPDLDGIEVLRRLRQDDRYKAVPVIVVTGRGAQEDKVKGLDAGADDYVVKPFDQVELLARVRSMVRIKEMHDSLEQWNRTLREQVRQQVAEVQRLARLKRYLSPQIAETVLQGDEETLTKGHRREVTVVSVRLRGFTEFAETTEPEEVFAFLKAFHAEMGELIFLFEGTVERLAGDELAIFFNDPVPVEDHTERAVRMALEIRDRVHDLREEWLKAGYALDVSVGVAAGYATLGEIGFEGRRDYAAVGNVANLVGRLADTGKGGQVLTTQKTLSRVEDLVEAEPLEEVRLPGFARPVPVFNLVRLKVPESAKPFAPLTQREGEVAALVAQGLTNRDIGKALFVTERTAESHVQRIMNKLGFHARSQIAAWAIARGLHKIPSK